MHKCPKCSLMYAEEAKICRTCGAILEEDSRPAASLQPLEAELVTVADVVESPPSEAEPLSEEDGEHRPAWNCPRCRESVPGKFDVCWNCFADRDGAIDPEFAEIAAADREHNREAGAEPPDEDRGDFESVLEAEIGETPPAHIRKASAFACPRCGSERIVRGARVLDRREHYSSDATVAVYGDPNALIFKDSLYGTLAADICGQCGHVELRVDNPAELYEHYRRAKK